MAYVAGFLSLVVVAVLAFWAGVAVNTHSKITERLRELGFTKDTAKLYARAAKILNRMVKVTELDGDFSADILSPETAEQVNDWLADYRKQVTKV